MTEILDIYREAVAALSTVATRADAERHAAERAQDTALAELNARIAERKQRLNVARGEHTRLVGEARVAGITAIAAPAAPVATNDPLARAEQLIGRMASELRGVQDDAGSLERERRRHAEARAAWDAEQAALLSAEQAALAARLETARRGDVGAKAVLFAASLASAAAGTAGAALIGLALAAVGVAAVAMFVALRPTTFPMVAARRRGRGAVSDPAATTVRRSEGAWLSASVAGAIAGLAAAAGAIASGDVAIAAAGVGIAVLAAASLGAGFRTHTTTHPRN